MSGELETVATFNDLTQAQSARSALESAEIESFLQDEATGSIDWGLLPALGGLRLQVKSADVAGAREVLANLDRTVAETIESYRRIRRRPSIVKPQDAGNAGLD